MAGAILSEQRKQKSFLGKVLARTGEPRAPKPREGKKKRRVGYAQVGTGGPADDAAIGGGTGGGGGAV